MKRNDDFERLDKAIEDLKATIKAEIVKLYTPKFLIPFAIFSIAFLIYLIATEGL